MPYIIDTTNDVTLSLNKLRANGIKTVIRYLALGTTWKTVTVREARAMQMAPMRLGLVFEVDGKPHGTAMGNRDGMAVIAGARSVGAPGNAIIWYTVDYDAGPSDIPGILDAFRAFKDQLRLHYRVGAYCSGYVAEALISAGLVDTTKDITTGKTLPCIWITQSLGFRGSRDYLNSGKPFVLFQLMPGQTAGLDSDPDIVWHNYLSEIVDIGDFIPFAGT